MIFQIERMREVTFTAREVHRCTKKQYAYEFSTNSQKWRLAEGARHAHVLTDSI